MCYGLPVRSKRTMIDAYSFGTMKVDGKTYSSDLILYPDGTVNSSWWRRSGHLLQREDLERTTEVKPEIVIIGTGTNGMMRVERGVVDHLLTQCSRVIVEKTGKVVKDYNELSPHHSIVGLFHLTC